MLRRQFTLAFVAALAAAPLASAAARGAAPAPGALPGFEAPALVAALVGPGLASIRIEDGHVTAARAIYFTAFAVALDQRWGFLPAAPLASATATLQRLVRDGASGEQMAAKDVRASMILGIRDAQTFAGSVDRDSPEGRKATAELTRLIVGVRSRAA